MKYYEAIDVWNSPNYLAHYKYIKKIKIGPFTRYFYSMKDLQEYYKNANKADTKAANKAFGTDSGYDLARAALNSEGASYLISPEEKKKTLKTINQAQNLKKTTLTKKKIGNIFEVGHLYVSNLFGSGSKKDLELKEKSHYAKRRKKNKKSIKSSADKFTSRLEW